MNEIFIVVIWILTLLISVQMYILYMINVSYRDRSKLLDENEKDDDVITTLKFFLKFGEVSFAKHLYYRLFFKDYKKLYEID